MNQMKYSHFAWATSFDSRRWGDGEWWGIVCPIRIAKQLSICLLCIIFTHTPLFLLRCIVARASGRVSTSRGRNSRGFRSFRSHESGDHNVLTTKEQIEYRIAGEISCVHSLMKLPKISNWSSFFAERYIPRRRAVYVPAFFNINSIIRTLTSS